jgi:hypothetical protein
MFSCIHQLQPRSSPSREELLGIRWFVVDRPKRLSLPFTELAIVVPGVVFASAVAAVVTS